MSSITNNFHERSFAILNKELREMWRMFYDWVVGNGPRPENEVIPPEPPPNLPFTQKPKDKFSRFHEATLKERYNQWLEIHGLHIFAILYGALSILTCVVIVLLLMITVAELPQSGAETYLARDTGVQNIVAGVIFRTRAFDRFGENAVLFTAAVSVLMLLGASRRNKFIDQPSLKNKTNGRNFLQRGPPILQNAALILVPAILVMGCVFVVSGHSSPGGAVLSAALMLAACAYGFERVHGFFSERTFIITISTSLLIYALSDCYLFLTGANQIHSNIPQNIIDNICASLIVWASCYAFCALFSEGDI